MILKNYEFVVVATQPLNSEFEWKERKGNQNRMTIRISNRNEGLIYKLRKSINSLLLCL